MSAGEANESSEQARHERAMEILADALELPREQRAAFLDRACGADQPLRARIEHLLGHEAAANISLKTENARAAVLESLAPPEQIGACKIIRELGQGGMSIVYLAMQQSPVRRPVAIKLLLPGMDTREVLRRFEAEREVLARLSHPNVAQVYDAGTTETGRPYFVMEYVDGVSITEYCDTRRLTTKQRLELLIPVCDAVQHAHQKAIIHRDLKPSNVLVVEREGARIPKVIDFGIAKATDPVSTSRTMFTEHGQLLGTPEYMSPEQASMGALDVDTRTDVYSLGVLLYELLTGSLPFESKTLRGAAYDEIRRMIREVDPPRPSTRLSTHAGDTEIIARARQSDVRALLRNVRGDLDWITMKALEKDRQRRYGSPSELADDLRRHLHDEPVVARPPSTAYRMRKFVHRHRAAVAAAGLLVLCLIGGIITTTWQAVRARRAERDAVAQRAIAEKRFNDVRKLAGTMIFDVDDAMEKSGVTRARQLLVDTAIKYLDGLSAESNVSGDKEFAREIVRAYERVGRVQYFPGAPSLDNPKGAIQSFQKALDLAKRLMMTYPEDRSLQYDVAMMWMLHGDAVHVVNGPNVSRESFKKAIDLAQPLADTDSKDTRARRCVSIACGRISQGYHDQHNGKLAMEWEQRQHKINSEMLATDPTDEKARRAVAASTVSIGRLLLDMGSPQQAREYLRSNRQMLLELSSASADNIIYQRELVGSLMSLAQADADCLALPDSMKARREVFEGRKLAADKDPSNSLAMQDLAAAHFQIAQIAGMMGQTVVALDECTKALAIQRPLADKKGTSLQSRRALAQMDAYLAEVLVRMNRPDDAVAAAKRAQDIIEGSMGMKRQHVGHLPEITISDHAMGVAQLAAGKKDEAVADLSREVEARVRLDEAGAQLCSDRHKLLVALISKADAQLALGNSKEAEQTAQEAVVRGHQLVADAPEAKRYAASLAQAQLVLSQAMLQNQKRDEALKLLDSARKLIDPIVQAAPDFAEAKETHRRAIDIAQSAR